MRFVLRIASVVVLLSALAFSQTTDATITGRIVDATNSLVTDARVEAVSLNTNVRYSGQTNHEGLFTITGVPPGPYRVQVSKAGFRTVVREDVVLRVQDIVALNFTLQVGSISETVTVTGGAPLVDTQSAAVSTVIDQSYVANMPLNGRSFQDLILLTPGIVTNSPQNSSITGVSGEFSVNGQRTESNNYTVDGVSANVGATANTNTTFYGTTDGAGASGSVPGATALGTTQALVSVDDLQEFRVQSSTYSAGYGRYPGGQFAFQTKSGANQRHGTAFDYLRNDYFDSTDYFTNYFKSIDPSLTKAAVRQNDFGGTLGGPVRIPGLYNGKDKSFFFFSYEGLRLILPQPAATSDVPDLCMRGSVPDCPAGRAPAAAALLPWIQSFPLPTPGAFSDPTNGYAEFIGSWSNPSSVDSLSVRFDQVVSDKLKLFFRFSDTASDSITRGLAIAFIPPTYVVGDAPMMHTYTIGADSLLSKRVSNQFRLNYSSNFDHGTNTIGAFGGSAPVDLNQLAGLTNFPNAGSAIYVLLGNSVFLQQPHVQTRSAQKQWNLVDTATFAAGHHAFNFGVDYRRLAPFGIPVNPFPTWFFGDENSVETNTASPSSSAYAPAYPLYHNFSVFADDTWKVMPRLTVSMGLRWDVNPPPGVTRGLMPYTFQFNSPDPTTWTLAPQGTPLWHTTWFNFAPRLGVAYALRDTTQWQTVLRGGFGVFYDTAQQMGSQGFEGPGFNATSYTASPIFPGDAVANTPTITNPPGAGPFATVVGFYPHLQLPYTLEWNVSVEQALGGSQTITASYVGSHGARLLENDHFSNPLSYNPVTVVKNGLRSDYDALQLQYQRRLSRGLTALASYTWSHCLDFGSSNFDFGYEREACDFDVRHNFTAAFSYDLPGWGHGKLADALLHHWGMDDRFLARTAFPVDLRGNQAVDPVTGRRTSNGLDFVTPRLPIYISGAECENVYAVDFGSTLPCPGGMAINPDAFTSAPGVGDVPRNYFRGFGAWQMNLAVRREFPLKERFRLQFRAEAFNIFNHPNFGTIDYRFGSSTFGQTTATLANSIGTLNPLYQMGGPRSMQFALKLMF